MKIRSLLLIILAVALSLILLQCTSTAITPAPTSATVQNEPASLEPIQTQSTPAENIITAKLDGKVLVETRCTTCHGLSRIESTSKSADQWKTTVEKMVGKGANLNAEELQAVIQYLTDTYK